MKYATQLDQHLETTSGQPILVNNWFYWFSFDLVTMAKSFDMLRDEKWHYVIMMIRKFLALLGPITPVPWMARLGLSIPGATPDWNSFVTWCKTRMGECIEMDVDKPGISSWLIYYYNNYYNYWIILN